MARLFAAVCLLIAVSLSCAHTGVRIGTLPTHFHEVSGNFSAINASNFSKFCILNFTYDGLGPDAFLYFYYPGDELSDAGGGVIIPISDQRVAFEVGRRYNNEEFCFHLPPNYNGCDFGGFGIWCRYANQLFTTISWNYDDVYSMTDTADRITCTPSPGRGYVGVLPTLEHDVGGTLYIRDNKTFVIRGFTYDGLGPDAFVYPYEVGVEVDNTGGGVIIPLPADNGGVPDEEGRFILRQAYDGSTDFFITIPEDGGYTCDYGAFTIWCRAFTQLFTNIEISGEIFTNNILEYQYQPNRIFCDRPATRPGVYVGEFPTDDPRAISGSFYVQDEYTFFIQLFSFSAQRDNVYMYVFETGVAVTEDGEDGIVVPFSQDQESLPSGRSNSYYNQDFTVDLRLISDQTVRACDLGYFAFIDTTDGAEERLTKVIIPTDIFSSTDTDGKITCVSGCIGLFSSILSLLGALLLAYVFKV